MGGFRAVWLSALVIGLGLSAATPTASAHWPSDCDSYNNGCVGTTGSESTHCVVVLYWYVFPYFHCPALENAYDLVYGIADQALQEVEDKGRQACENVAYVLTETTPYGWECKA